MWFPGHFWLGGGGCRLSFVPRPVRINHFFSLRFICLKWALVSCFASCLESWPEIASLNTVLLPLLTSWNQVSLIDYANRWPIVQWIRLELMQFKSTARWQWSGFKIELVAHQSWRATINHPVQSMLKSISYSVNLTSTWWN